MKRILLFIMAITFSLAPFAQNHTAQKKPVRKTAVTAKRRLLLLPERRTAEGMCPENIQISCVNQSRTQGGNL